MYFNKNKSTVLRQELKYYLNVNNIIHLRRLFDNILHVDSHANDITNDYKVTSLYFDTIYNNDLDEKLDGIFSREKVRIRIYDNQSNIKLEFKKREGTRIDKRTYVVSRKIADQIINGDYSILNGNDNYSIPMLEPYIKLKGRGYRPRVIVQYDREAYTLPHGDTRITIDKNLRTYNSETNLFNIKLSSTPIFPDNLQILEVKFSNFLPRQVKYVLNSVKAIPHSISKFTLCQRFIDRNPWRDELVVPF